jgi:hypothetical protein
VIYPFYRDYMRVPLSIIPTWARICLVVTIGSMFLTGSRFVPREYDDLIFWIGFISGFVAISYLCVVRLGHFMKTGSND